MIPPTELAFRDLDSTSFRVWWNAIANYMGIYTVIAQPGNHQINVSANEYPTALFTNLDSSTVYDISVQESGAIGSIRTCEYFKWKF